MTTQRQSPQTESKATNAPVRQPDVQGVELETQRLPSMVLQAAVADPRSAPAAAILQLQRSYGNRAVSKLIQAKLKVGPAGDKYEEEADRIADQVMRMPSPAAKKPLQRQPLMEDEEELQMKPMIQRQTPEEEEEALQMKPMHPEKPSLQLKPLVQRQAPEEEEELQMKPLLQPKQLPSISNLQSPNLHLRPIVNPKSKIQNQEGGFETNDSFHRSLSASKGNGSPLPDQLRADFEPKFGADFGDVRAHSDSNAAQLNRQIGAQAFTHGNDVFFGAGKYNPGSTSGKQLIAHELTHTVQQGGALQRQGDNDDWGQLKPLIQPQGIARRIQREPDKFLIKTFKRIDGPQITLGNYAKNKLEEFYTAKQSEVKSLLNFRMFSFGLGKLLEPKEVTERIEKVKGHLLMVAYGSGLESAEDYKKRLLTAGLTKNKVDSDDEVLDGLMEELNQHARVVNNAFMETARIEAEEDRKRKVTSAKGYFNDQFLSEDSGFWQKLGEVMKSDDLEQEYRRLQGVAPNLEGFTQPGLGTYMTSFKATAPSESKDTVGEPGLEGEEVVGEESDLQKKTPKDEYFVKLLRDREAFDKAIEAKKKNIISPLLARSLGVDNLPLAAGAFRNDAPMIYTQLVKGKDFSKLNYDDTDEAGDIKKIKNIDLAQLQKTVLFDMLFENQDAHYKQYMITTAGELLKIDQEAYLWEQSKYLDRSLRAGSFLAGLPQANAPLAPATLAMVKGWNSENLAALMSRAGIFSEDEVERVQGNMSDIKNLMPSDGEEKSIRAVFAEYNGYDSPDEIPEFEGKETNIATKLALKGTMLGEALTALEEVQPILGKLDDMEGRYKERYTE